MTVRIATLGNGIRVVTDSYDSPLAVVEICVEVGTRWEPPLLNGLAHFLEHMAFKGTTSRDAKALSHEIEARGGWINAGTGKDTTAYFAGVLAEDAAVALDVLADIVCNPTLPADEFERERGVILQEMADLEDDPMSWLGDRMMEKAFIGGLSLPGLGFPDILAEISRDDLTRFIHAHYTPSRILVGAAGGVDHDAICRDAERLMSGFGAPGIAAAHISSRPAGGVYRSAQDTEQVHLIVVFPSLPMGHPDLYADSVLHKILGGCSTSRLWQAIREERGLCYGIHSSVQAWQEAGLAGVQLSTGADVAAEAIDVLAAELRRLRDGGISDEELTRGKKLTHAEIVMSHESVESRTGAAMHHLAIHGIPYDLQDELDKFAAVDHAAIRRVIDRMWASPGTVAIRGPERITNLVDERTFDAA